MGAPLQPDDLCPWCDYDLMGLAKPALCPECGRKLGLAARALAEARQASRQLWARLVLLISPGVGIFAIAGVFILHHDGLIWIGSAMLLTLTLSAFICLYFGRPRRRRNWRLAAALAFPLGIAYFIAVTLAAVIVVLLIGWFSR